MSYHVFQENPMTAPDSRDSVELLPCPFCGHDESLYIEHVEGTILHPAYYVRCDYCGAQNGSTDKGDHVQQWNRRALARGPQQAGGDVERDAERWRTLTSLDVGEYIGITNENGPDELGAAIDTVIKKAAG